MEFEFGIHRIWLVKMVEWIYMLETLVRNTLQSVSKFVTTTVAYSKFAKQYEIAALAMLLYVAACAAPCLNCFDTHTPSSMPPPR